MKARTALGRRLLELRAKAVESGMQLLTLDQINAEVARRRSGGDDWATELGRENVEAFQDEKFAEIMAEYRRHGRSDEWLLAKIRHLFTV